MGSAGRQIIKIRNDDRRGLRAGAGDRERLVMEILTSIRRAGADLILTYHAPLAAELLSRS